MKSSTIMWSSSTNSTRPLKWRMIFSRSNTWLACHNNNITCSDGKTHVTRALTATTRDHAATKSAQTNKTCLVRRHAEHVVGQYNHNISSRLYISVVSKHFCSILQRITDWCTYCTNRHHFHQYRFAICREILYFGILMTTGRCHWSDWVTYRTF